ncbi:hypothetical protein [Myroides guanonis]|nr:hypothetical protein [Myroides guanonis]
MEDIWNKILIAILSAFIALVLKHFYDNNQKKKRLKKIELAFKQILSTSILDCLISLKKYSEHMSTVVDIETTKFKFPPTNSIDIDLLNLFDKTDLVDIFTKKGIGINIIYDINMCIKMLHDENPRAIIVHFKNTMNDIIIDDNRTQTDLKEEFASNPRLLNDFLNKSQQNKSDTYDVTVEKFKVFTFNCSKTIASINQLLLKF